MTDLPVVTSVLNAAKTGIGLVSVPDGDRGGYRGGKTRWS